jgi:hypothetical protein
MYAEKNEMIAKMNAADKEKDRVLQVQTEIRSAMRQLSGEKCSLLLQHAAETQKQSKSIADVIMEQIEDIQMQMEKHSSQLLSLESTPKNNNHTPESATD